MNNLRIGLMIYAEGIIDDGDYFMLKEIKDTLLRSPLVGPLIKVITLKNLNQISDEVSKEIDSIQVLICDPRIFKNEIMFKHAENLKWVHIIFAGVDGIVRYYENKEKPNFILSRTNGNFDVQMVEYVLGHIICRERRFQYFKESQEKKQWNFTTQCRTLGSLVIGVVGFGGIGKKLAEIAMAFQAEVVAYVRRGSTLKNSSKGIKITDDLTTLLESSDYIVSILPSVPTTDGFYDGEVLKDCKKKPVFVNIGRGNCIKEETLIRALDNGWISHAILDVVEKEPLPSESLLWSRDDVTITPHISGVVLDIKSLCNNFINNYEAFCSGKEMKGVVDWTKGY